MCIPDSQNLCFEVSMSIEKYGKEWIEIYSNLLYSYKEKKIKKILIIFAPELFWDDKNSPISDRHFYAKRENNTEKNIMCKSAQKVLK